MSSPPLDDQDATAALLARFVSAFRRGLDREIAAMQQAPETFELALSNGEALGTFRYGFELPEPSDKLAVGMECRLRTPRGESRITIEALHERHATVTSSQVLDLSATPMALVVSPRFLYDRLLEALGELDVERYSAALALTVFGKRAARRVSSTLRGNHEALNRSQQMGVQLCSDSNVAFLWGPPGTGKTATLLHVIEELRAQGKRILLTSTTNAAVDHVLAKMASRPWFASAANAGELVRLGRSSDETFGVELADLVGRSEDKHRRSLDRLRARVAQLAQATQHVHAALAELERAATRQQSLFAERTEVLSTTALSMIFSRAHAEKLQRLPAPEQEEILRRRLARLQRARTLAKDRIAAHVSALRDSEARVVGAAGLVMCTLTNAYLSPLMKGLRFDVLITEEAGMAALPLLFYAACLCRERAIIVGDPRQLRPIVQSNEDLAQRTLGRSVFDVTTPDPASSELVVMLDMQYRMHPAIGSLVGRLFYGGRLTHGADLNECQAIASLAPYPGQPLIVVDLGARSTCQRSGKGTSRVNAVSAAVTARLAHEAVVAGASSVAVITPYAAQSRDIRRRIAALGIEHAVECNTIHRFQGRERDVVLIDLVDALPMHPGILLAGAPASNTDNLLNVSISRARGKLIIVADVSYFEEHVPRGTVTTVLREAIRGGARVSMGPLDT